MSKIVCKEEKLLVSAVGGLGKTELVKHFLHKLTKTEVSTSGIEVVAWVSYNNNIIPFIIGEELKLYYYRGLKEWDVEKGYLRDTCLSAQDNFYEIIKHFRIDELIK